MKRLYSIIFFLVVLIPFAIGQTMSFVMFDNVKAYEKNGGVQIEWTNLTERDLNKYIIERSADGNLFDTLQGQSPAYNNNDRADYTIYDASPRPGANFYRIRVSGIGGKSILSAVLRVEIEQKQKGFTLYPNPVTGDDLSINLTAGKQGTLSVSIMNMSGLKVFQKSIRYEGRSMTTTVSLPAGLRAGVYLMTVGDDDWQEKKMFIRN